MTRDLKNALSSLGASVRARSEAKAPACPEALAPQELKPLQLPLWPEASRGVPNVALRSALFGAIRRGPRSYLESEHIAALDGVEILYTGQRLDQGDLDVWETLLHITRLQNMGEQCRFSAAEMLKKLGKTNSGGRADARKAPEKGKGKWSGGNRDVLHKRLLRLKATAVEIRCGSLTYAGSLIGELYKDEVTQYYVVILNPKLIALFEKDQFTNIDWNVRQELNGKPLAQWLHGFYASHAKPHPISIRTLRAICGSGVDDIYKYAQTLRVALEAVAKASAAHGQSFKYKINGELVYVEKTPTPTQRRHLARRQDPTP